MAGTGVINKDHINLEFWTAWPRRFYNIRAYDSTKENLENHDSDHEDAMSSEEDNQLRLKEKKVFFFLLER